SACIDARYSGGRVARLVKARSYDLGVFPLRYLVQPRPVRAVLRAPAALLASRFSDAESRGRRRAGCGSGRLHLVRAQSANRSNAAAVAAGRTDFALCRNLPDDIAGAELRKSAGLFYGTYHKNRRNKRPRHRSVGVHHSTCAPARATAAGLPAPALGDL